MELSAALADRIDQLYREALSAWPALGVSAAAFTERLRGHLAGEADPLRYLGGVQAADLYLACACSADDPAGLAALEALLRSKQSTFLSGLRLPAATVEDVGQLVRLRLLTGTAEAPPRIRSYAGRGSLEGWLRTLCVRTALNLTKKKDERLLHPREAIAERVLDVGASPELLYLKERYAGPCREALRDALQALTEEQRGVLHLYLVAGLSTVRIGALYQVNHSTVSRWLSAAKGTIQREAQRLLRERLGLSGEELVSLVRLLQSQLDLSLDAALRPQGARDEPSAAG